MLRKDAENGVGHCELDVVVVKVVKRNVIRQVRENIGDL